MEGSRSEEGMSDPECGETEPAGQVELVRGEKCQAVSPDGQDETADGSVRVVKSRIKLLN